MLFADMHSHFLLKGHYLGQSFTDTQEHQRVKSIGGINLTLREAITGNVGCMTFAAYTAFGRFSSMSAIMEQYDTVERNVAATCGQVVLAKTGAQVKEIVDSGKIAGILALEGGYNFHKDPSILPDLAHRGVRLVTLAHFISTALADASTRIYRPNNGLSKAGIEVVKQMCALKIMPDVAHLSDKAIEQVTANAEGPVVSSHTGMSRIRKCARNLSDDMAKRIVATGGMIGIIWLPYNLSATPLGYDASLEHWLDHCCHAASLVGAANVGIGTDLGAPGWFAKGLRGYSDFPALAEGLARRGFSAPEIAGIMGQNYVRTLGA